MVVQLSKPQYQFTTSEYLEFEEKSEIIEMAGGSTSHNKIALNFCRQFPLEVNSQNYEVYMNDVRLWIETPRIYTYPDVMVVKGKPIYEGKNQTMIINPLLIVEVLSDSTESYDRTEKFSYYRTIPAFQEYLLISQHDYYLEQFAKNPDGQWCYESHQGQEAIAKLNTVQVEIPLHELYKRVEHSNDIKAAIGDGNR
jgi:Uma2 family endonuclease